MRRSAKIDELSLIQDLNVCLQLRRNLSAAWNFSAPDSKRLHSAAVGKLTPNDRKVLPCPGGTRAVASHYLGRRQHGALQERQESTANAVEMASALAQLGYLCRCTI